MSRTHYTIGLPYSTALRHKPKRTHTPSTAGQYKPGIGYTITKVNIEAYQQQLAEEGRPAATPEQIVTMFATDTDRKNKAGFVQSKEYKRRLMRALVLMTPKKTKNVSEKK